jgi:hypothetical protein
MTAQNVTAFVFFMLLLGTGVAIAVSIAWFDHRTRSKALDVLRAYAERGEEPPPSVTQTLTVVSGGPRKAPDPTDYTRDRLGRPRTRGGYLTHAAANAVFAAGFSGLTWWRISETGEASPGVVVAILFGLFFAASVAAQLVGAYYAPDR